MWRLSDPKMEPVIEKEAREAAKAVRIALNNIDSKCNLTNLDSTIMLDVLLTQIELQARKIINSKFI